VTAKFFRTDVHCPNFQIQKLRRPVTSDLLGTVTVTDGTLPVGMRQVEYTVRWVERWWHLHDLRPPDSSPGSHPDPAHNEHKTQL